MEKSLKKPGPKRWDILAEILPKDRAVVFVELGVWIGQTMKKMLVKMPKLLYRGVDAWAPPRIDQTGFGENLSTFSERTFRIARRKTEKIAAKFKRRALLLVMDTVEAAKQFSDKSIDCVFIDGDHSYSGCKRDILAWQSKIKKGGIMAGHDYANEHGGEVKKAVDEIFGKVELFPDHVWVRRF